MKRSKFEPTDRQIRAGYRQGMDDGGIVLDRREATGSRMRTQSLSAETLICPSACKQPLDFRAMAGERFGSRVRRGIHHEQRRFAA